MNLIGMLFPCVINPIAKIIQWSLRKKTFLFLLQPWFEGDLIQTTPTQPSWSVKKGKVCFLRPHSCNTTAYRADNEMQQYLHHWSWGGGMEHTENQAPASIRIQDGWRPTLWGYVWTSCGPQVMRTNRCTGDIVARQPRSVANDNTEVVLQYKTNCTIDEVFSRHAKSSCWHCNIMYCPDVP